MSTDRPRTGKDREYLGIRDDEADDDLLGSPLTYNRP